MRPPVSRPLTSLQPKLPIATRWRQCVLQFLRLPIEDPYLNDRVAAPVQPLVKQENGDVESVASVARAGDGVGGLGGLEDVAARAAALCQVLLVVVSQPSERVTQGVLLR